MKKQILNCDENVRTNITKIMTRPVKPATNIPYALNFKHRKHPLSNILISRIQETNKQKTPESIFPLVSNPTPTCQFSGQVPYVRLKEQATQKHGLSQSRRTSQKATSQEFPRKKLVEFITP